MNNKYFATLLCLTALALVPACGKKREKKVVQTRVVEKKENANGKTVVSRSAIRIEDDNARVNVSKF